MIAPSTATRAKTEAITDCSAYHGRNNREDRRAETATLETELEPRQGRDARQGKEADPQTTGAGLTPEAETTAKKDTAPAKETEQPPGTDSPELDPHHHRAGNKHSQDTCHHLENEAGHRLTNEAGHHHKTEADQSSKTKRQEGELNHVHLRRDLK